MPKPKKRRQTDVVFPISKRLFDFWFKLFEDVTKWSLAAALPYFKLSSAPVFDRWLRTPLLYFLWLLHVIVLCITSQTMKHGCAERKINHGLFDHYAVDCSCCFVEWFLCSTSRSQQTEKRARRKAENRKAAALIPAVLRIVYPTPIRPCLACGGFFIHTQYSLLAAIKNIYSEYTDAL